jgi:hypothetical protein
VNAAESVKLMGIPERIFVSVDERTGRSTLSYAPKEIGAPIVREGDHRGEQAMVAARAIAASYPGCAIAGPHFHASRPPGSSRPRRGR